MDTSLAFLALIPCLKALQNNYLVLRFQERITSLLKQNPNLKSRSLRLTFVHPEVKMLPRSEPDFASGLV